MSSMDNWSTQDLMIAIAGPPRWGDKVKRLWGIVEDETGLKLRVIRAAWSEGRASRPTMERLRRVAETKLKIAAALEPGNADDRARADNLRRQARDLYAVADRG